MPQELRQEKKVLEPEREIRLKEEYLQKKAQKRENEDKIFNLIL